MSQVQAARPVHTPEQRHRYVLPVTQALTPPWRQVSALLARAVSIRPPRAQAAVIRAHRAVMRRSRDQLVHPHVQLAWRASTRQLGRVRAQVFLLLSFFLSFS